jgi:predicted TIM-barrel fold metal-dependent hydrolase
METQNIDAPNSTPPTAFPASMPSGSCDSHVHLFLPMQFPYSPQRQYTPPAATVDDLQRHLQRLGMARVVLVQPSCYGTDNSALLAGLRALGPERARAVAVIDPDAEPDLAQLHRAGVRGLRFNFTVQASTHLDAAGRQLKQVAAMLRPWGWHIQIQVAPAPLRSLAPTLAALEVPVVLDHFGGGPAAAETVNALLDQGNVWVKLSAPYRASRDPAHADLAPLVRSWVERAPSRLVWASDWPHTGGAGVRATSLSTIEPFRDVDAAQALRDIASWMPDERRLHRVLVDNPRELYDFGPARSPSHQGVST